MRLVLLSAALLAAAGLAAFSQGLQQDEQLRLLDDTAALARVEAPGGWLDDERVYAWISAVTLADSPCRLPEDLAQVQRYRLPVPRTTVLAESLGFINCATSELRWQTRLRDWFTVIAFVGAGCLGWALGRSKRH